MIDGVFDGTKVLDGVTDMSDKGAWFGHSMVIVGYVRSTIHAVGTPMNGYFILRNFARHNFADLIIIKDVLPPS